MQPPAIALGCLLVAGASLAQQRDASRGNVTDLLPKVELPTAAEAPVKLEIQPPPVPVDNPLARIVTPTRIDIQGVASIQFQEIASLFDGLTGKPTTVAELVRIAGLINDVYKTRGYALSFGYVPLQDFAQGVVRITVVEGYVGEIKLTGLADNQTASVRRIANRLLAEKPLKQATLERIVGAIALIPGLQTAATLAAPVANDGAAILTIEVKRQAWLFSSGLDSRAESLRGIFSATANNPLGNGEQLQVSALAPPGENHEQYYAAAYSQPIGSEGMVLKASASLYRSDPKDPVVAANGVAFQRRSENQRASVTLAYPLRLKSTESLIATAGVYAVNNQDRYQAIGYPVRVALTTDIRAIQGELAWMQVQTGRVRRAVLGLYQGLKLLGARRDNSVADLDFFRINAQFVQKDEWRAKIGTSVSLLGQYSANTLPSSEQISFGGTSFGRAYAPGLLAGDSGIGISLEINRRFNFDSALMNSLEPYAIVDAAYAHSNSVPLLLTRLSSVALGVRVADLKHYSVELDVAKPIGQMAPSNPDGKSRVNVNFSYQF